MRYTVLYTKQIRKKVKSYHDGYLDIHDARKAKLLGEDGSYVLSEAILPRSLQLTAGLEGIDCFDGYLINVEELHIPSGADASAQPAAASSQRGAVHGAAQHAQRAPALPASGKRKASFVRPRLLPGACTESFPPQPTLATAEAFKSAQGSNGRPAVVPAVSSKPRRIPGLPQPAIQCQRRASADPTVSMSAGTSAWSSWLAEEPAADISRSGHQRHSLDSNSVLHQPRASAGGADSLSMPKRSDDDILKAFCVGHSSGPPGVSYQPAMQQPTRSPAHTAAGSTARHQGTGPPEAGPGCTSSWTQVPDWDDEMGMWSSQVPPRPTGLLASIGLADRKQQTDTAWREDAAARPLPRPQQGNGLLASIGLEGSTTPAKTPACHNRHAQHVSPPAFQRRSQYEVCQPGTAAALADAANEPNPPLPPHPPIFGSAAGAASKIDFAADVATTTSGLASDVAPARAIQRSFKPPPMSAARLPALASQQRQLPASLRESANRSSRAAQPGQLAFSVSGQTLQRNVVVPDTFSSLAQYQQTWDAALKEEANLRFAEVAGRFYDALRRIAPTTKFAPLVAQGAHSVSKQPPKQTPDLEGQMRRGGIQYYGSCRLVHYSGGFQRLGGQKGGRKRQQEADDGGAAPATSKPSFYLELQGGRQRASAYRKGDLWAISNNERLAAATGPGSTDWVTIAQSCWHGPNADGRMEVELLGSRPPGLARTQSVFALHGPNTSTELGAAALITSLKVGTVALMPQLLSPAAQLRGADAAGAENAAIPSEAVQAAAERFGLNPEQAAALSAVEGWSAPSRAGDSVVLIHGPFGSGKSTLLVALIMFLRSQLPEGAMRNRVLVAAHTNAAVDRILLGLAEQGFTDFLRIGSLPRMDRKVLPFSLHCSDAKAKRGAAAELKDMLTAACSPQETAIIKAELAALQKGAEAARRKRLRTAAVVGTTCCAALTAEALEGVRFDVVLLDEASQVIEPLALAPIIRSKCRFLVAAGDPCQLPPLLAAPATLRGGKAGLCRPLFERLMAAGFPTQLLRRQYRCHPAISAVPNALFYGGKLLDGCTEVDRLPLLPGCPPLAFLDVRGNAEYQVGSRSTSNPMEAQAVAHLVAQLAAAGVAAANIGVICFFRAQVQCVQAALAASAVRSAAANPDGQAKGAAAEAAVQVATVDSFQGMEKEVIILTTAVTAPGAFASDARRLNVALTRARRHLFLIGCGPALRQAAPAFDQIITACRKSPNSYWSDGRMRLATGSSAAA